MTPQNMDIHASMAATGNVKKNAVGRQRIYGIALIHISIHLIDRNAQPRKKTHVNIRRKVQTTNNIIVS